MHDYAKLFRAAINGHDPEVYRLLGMLAKSQWNWGPVQVWAMSPAADLLCCRWSSEGPPCDVEREDLHELIEDSEKQVLQSESGWWLPIRASGHLVCVVRLDATHSPSWRPSPCDELLELPKLGSLALTRCYEKRLQKPLAVLLPKLKKLEPKDQIRLILRFALKLLECKTGTVAVLQADEPDWLKVIAAEGPNHELVLDRVPTTFRPVLHLLDRQLPIVVSTRSEHFFLAPIEQLRKRYGHRHSKLYIQLLRLAKSCVLLPLWDFEKIAGVVTVLRSTSESFEPEQLVTLTLLLRELRFAVAGFATSQSGETFDFPQSVPLLLQSLPGDNPADLANDLSVELAKQACILGKCHRAAVALRVSDEKALTISALWPPHNWPRLFQNDKLPFNEPAATVEAFRTGKPYAISDLREVGVKYLRVPLNDETIKSSAAIPIQAAGRKLGALALDWDGIAAFDNRLLNKLASLTNLFAQALEKADFGKYWKQLEDLLHPADGSLNWLEILKLFTAVTGAQAGSLFLVRPGERGRIYRKASVRQLDSIPSDDAFYLPGEGLTGWIFKHNEVLNLERVDDPDYLKSIHRDLKLAAKYLDCDKRGENDNAENPFLGLPIALGNRPGDPVIGVIRLRRTVKRRFNRLEVDLARAFMSRLVAFLQKQRNDHRSDVLLKLQQDLIVAEDRGAILKTMQQAIDSAMGETHFLIRGIEPIDGTEFLIPLYASSDDVRKTSPPILRKGESVSGLVWKNQKMCHVRDMKKPWEIPGFRAAVELAQEQWRTVLGLPLMAGKTFYGTLVFMDKQPDALSEQDVKFLQTVVETSFAAFVRARDRDRVDLTQNLYRIAGQFPYNLLASNADYDEQEFDLLTKLMESAAKTLGARAYCIGQPAHPAKLALFSADHQKVDEIQPSAETAGANAPLVIPTLPIEKIERLLGAKSFLLMNAKGVQKFYQELLGPDLVPEDLDTIAHLMSDSRLIVLPLRSESRLRSVFAFLIPEFSWLAHGIIDDVAAVLVDVEKILRTADKHRIKKAVATSRRLSSLLDVAASDLNHMMGTRIGASLGFLEVIKKQTSLAAIHGLVEDVKKGLLVFQQQANQFKTTAQQQITETPMKVDLVQVLNEVIAPSNKQVSFHPECNRDSMIDGWPSLLVYSFNHLWMNATRAIEGKPGGFVEVELRCEQKRCEVKIIDNGTGMDAETKRRAFDAHFSHNGSSGMGLANALDHIDFHGGNIRIESELGVGTTITVTLPRSLK